MVMPTGYSNPQYGSTNPNRPCPRGRSRIPSTLSAKGLEDADAPDQRARQRQVCAQMRSTSPTRTAATRIHKEQPRLVVHAVREVVNGVRDPADWRRGEAKSSPEDLAERVGFEP